MDISASVVLLYYAFILVFRTIFVLVFTFLVHGVCIGDRRKVFKSSKREFWRCKFIILVGSLYPGRQPWLKSQHREERNCLKDTVVSQASNQVVNFYPVVLIRLFIWFHFVCYLVILILIFVLHYLFYARYWIKPVYCIHFD